FLALFLLILGRLLLRFVVLLIFLVFLVFLFTRVRAVFVPLVVFVLVVVAEEVLRVVLDAQHVLSLELFTPGQVVVAGLEPEIHEVGFGDEAWGSDGRAGRDRRSAFLRWGVDVAAAPTALAIAFGLPLEALALAFDPLLLVLAPRALADRDAIEANRAPHVQAVANVPRVLAFQPVERRFARPEHLDALEVVEDVLLQGLAVDLAARE